MLSYAEAQELAVEVLSDGWTEVVVLGERPGGPPKTRHIAPKTRWSEGGRDALGRSPSRNVRRVPPTVRATGPDGRRRNIGSRRRWESLKAWTGTTNGGNDG